MNRGKKENKAKKRGRLVAFICFSSPGTLYSPASFALPNEQNAIRTEKGGY